ncbi:MAG: DUF418 domain-containing protein [bacterium]|nr:DUF418 domain-containing protein [bacterium]
MTAEATQPAERAEILDVLRGFALLGIFVAHVPGFSGWDYLSAADQARLDPGADVILQYIREVLVRGKFYSLFSLLFGFGFAIQHARARARGVGFAALFGRRQLGLLALGVVHSVFWHGDILLTYALLGFLLIPLADRSPRWIAGWALGLFALRAAWGVVMWLAADGLTSLGGSAVSDGSGGVDVMGNLSRVTAGYASPHLGEMLSSNLRFLRLKWLLALYDGRLFSIGAFFLLGVALGKWRVHEQVIARSTELRRLAWLAGCIGLLGNLGLAFLWPRVLTYPPTVAGVWTNLLYALAVPSLAIAMAAGIASAWGRGEGRSVLAWFGPPGRMALTTYVAQTAIGIGVFYGIGFGLRGSISLSTGLAMALGVFALQAVAANAWLRHYRYGPLEWAWRCFTYGSALPIRRASRHVGPMGAADG